MSNPLAVRTMWLGLVGLMMTISAHAIERPPSVDSLDQETRNILAEKNRIGGFVATVDAKTRLAVDKFQVISARGEILGQSRLVDPNALSSFVMRNGSCRWRICCLLPQFDSCFCWYGR